MFVSEVGLVTTLLLGVTLAVASFAFTVFWVQLFARSFDAESKYFWPLFWIHLLVWVGGLCVAPYEWINDNPETWGWPFIIYFLGSPAVMAVVKLCGTFKARAKENRPESSAYDPYGRKGTPARDLMLPKDEPAQSPYESVKTTADDPYEYVRRAEAEDYYRLSQEAEKKKKKKNAILLCVIIVLGFIAYNIGKEAGSSIATLPRPQSGEILDGAQYGGSEITVTADSSEDLVVSLKDYRGNVRTCFYVRAGETVTMAVPSEWLYVYFACGDKWYGYGEGRMFGKHTTYSKDDEIKDFEQYTWRYRLYPVTSGNFEETPTNEEDFFS